MARHKPRRNVTLSPEVDAYLSKPEVNASGLIDAAVREKIQDYLIEKAAREAGVTEESE